MRITKLGLIACLGLGGCAELSVDEPNRAAAPAAADEVPAVGPSADTEDEITTNESVSEKEEPVTTDTTPTQYNELNEFEQYVILNKGTERAFTGEYTDLEDKGTYLCRRCNAALYKSDHKFHSNCGWPAFDDEIEGAVTRLADADGMRTEILCTNCGGHLGHVFAGERLTENNIRHCVNSVSMNFVSAGEPLPEPVIAGSAK
ncbi:MAG: methionine-R-sulfoxide reductase [Fuerstiella sp.]|nr:methionine-R-sulfoxide reductase [Fuerstiella sp.]